MTFFAFGFGDPGGDAFECRDDTETFALLCRVVLTGSLRDINFRTAFGLSVPNVLPAAPEFDIIPAEFVLFRPSETKDADEAVDA